MFINKHKKIVITLMTFAIGISVAFSWFALMNEFGIFSIAQIEIKETDSLKPISSNDTFYLKGKREAKQDIKSGKFVILVKGVTRFGAVLENELSKSDVKVQSIGCSFKETDEKYLKGYNDVSISAINAHFGQYILGKAFDKAKEQDIYYREEVFYVK